MLANIDCMIDYSELMNNPKAAKIFDDMEKFVQDSKFKIQQLVMSDKLTQPKEGSIEFAAFLYKERFKVCHPLSVVRRLSSAICRPSSVIRHLYLLSSHVSTLVHCISNVTLCSMH
jgi:hypothetical protein